jgi:hypothetical protein
VVASLALVVIVFFMALLSFSWIRHPEPNSSRRATPLLQFQQPSGHSHRLFPRDAYRRTFDRLRERLSDRKACRLMVDLLALAHERGCEAELAGQLAADLDAGQLPDLGRLRAHFAPDPACVPQVMVQLAPLASYECLIGASQVGDAA